MKSIFYFLIIFTISFISGGTPVSEKSNFTDEDKMHHYMGIEMNIQTWNLLGKKDRSEQDNVRMVMFAKASLYHWQNSPNFQPINEQRGQWMIANAYTNLDMGEKAIGYAQETMRLTDEHKFDDFDLAYAYEAMARANASLKNNDECQEWYKKAEDAGNKIKENEDKKLFLSDLQNGPWFGCR